MKVLWIVLVLLWRGFVYGESIEEKCMSLSNPSEIVKAMEKEYKKPCVYVPYVSSGVTLDGRMQDSAWKKAKPVSFAFMNGTDGTPMQKTELRIISDAQFLYIGFTCFENDMDGMVAFARERDGALWKDDSVEIFIDVENKGKWPHYFHFGTNIKGIILDSKWRKSFWDSNVIVRTHQGDTKWSAEFAIPLSDLFKDLKSMTPVWGANFTRCRQGRLRKKDVRNEAPFIEDTAWSPTGSWDAHEPEDFGHLFIEVVRKIQNKEVSPKRFVPQTSNSDPMKTYITPSDLAQGIAKRFGDPAVYVPMTARPPKIDGTLDEIEWKTATAFSFRFMDGSDQEPSQKTVGRLLCDTQNLHLAFECLEQDPAGIKADVKNHDGPVWQDDDIEIFLEPAHQHSFKYFQIAVNARGVTFEALNKRNRSWNPECTVKTRIAADRWIVEMSIPFKELRLAPGKIPALWGANFYRVRQCREGAVGEETSWSPTQARTSHVPSRFGHIYLEVGNVFPDMSEEQIVMPVAQKGVAELHTVSHDVFGPEEQKEFSIRSMTLTHLAGISEQLWQKNHKRLLQVDTVEKWEKRKKEIRAAFWKSIGGMPRKKCPLDVRIQPGPRGDGWEVFNVIYQSRPDFWVAGNLYKPRGRKGPFPGVLRVIGHSSSGKRGKGVYNMHVQLARKGYVSLAIDGLGQGERMICGRGFGEETPTSNHYAQGSRAFLVGANLAVYMVWDGIRGIDYLLSLPEVDASRIAVTGCSGGGTMSIYLGCLDERIGVVIPVSAGGSPHFGSNYDAEQNLYARYRDGFDFSGMFALCAPRPLKVIREVSGALDTPEPSAEAARRIYTLYGVPDRIEYQKTHHPHGYGQGHRRPAIAWLDKWCGKNPKDIQGRSDKIKPVDLISSKTGMVFYSREFPEQETAISLQKKKAVCSMAFLEQPKKAAAVQIHRKKVLEKLAQLLCMDDVTFSRLKKKQTLELRECIAEKLFFTTDPGIVVSCLVLKPKRLQKSCKTLIWIYERNRTALIEKRYCEIVSLLDNGWIICMPNVRGTGESAPQSAYTFHNAETAQNCGGFETGHPLIGFRVKDIRCTVDYLASRSDVDQKRICLFGDSLARINPERIPYKRQIVSAGPNKIYQGQSLGAHLAVLAGALDKRIHAVAVNGMLYSYKSLFDEFYFYHQNNLWIPGILMNFDMGDICATLAPRPFLMVNPVDSLNSRASENELNKEYSRAKAVYTANNAPDHIRIQQASNVFQVCEWLGSLD